MAKKKRLTDEKFIPEEVLEKTRRPIDPEVVKKQKAWDAKHKKSKKKTKKSKKSKK